MSTSTASISPLIVQTSTGQTKPEYITIINPDGSISYEQNLHYEQPTIIRRTYSRPPKAKRRYKIAQEGESYRCCRWCQQWCTRRCSIFSCCDEIFSCPLICYILGALLLLSLLAGIITLFALHPDINPDRRYHGIIHTLSIYNRTKYIYNLDKNCSYTDFFTHCLDISTSTSISIFATTVVLNRTALTVNYSSLLLFICLILFCFQSIRNKILY